ncbi:hypothetical protein [Rhodococcus sp. 24CO]|uniref:hypothetical protein n=1 Tax=Rhodococcus sp. 24CO TaxID=3117460 RepID=UPI003D34C469
MAEGKFKDRFRGLAAAETPEVDPDRAFAARAADGLIRAASNKVSDVVSELELVDAPWILQPSVDSMRSRLVQGTVRDESASLANRVQHVAKERGMEVSFEDAHDAVVYVHSSRYLAEVGKNSSDLDLGSARSQAVVRDLPPAVDNRVNRDFDVADDSSESGADRSHARASGAYTDAPREPAESGAEPVGEQAPTVAKDRLNTVAVDDGVRIDPLAAAAAPAKNQSKRRSELTAPKPDQRVHDLAAWLTQTAERRNSGQKVTAAKPIKEVLGHFKSAPIDQTRIQVLAAAAAARHLEGEQSTNAQRLNQLVQDNDARLNAIRDHERRSAALEHKANGSSREEIDAWDQERIQRDASTDRQVFNAAAAVAAGYVAARGLPAYDQLAQLSDSQLGPLPEAPTPETDPQTPTQGGPSNTENVKGVLDSVGGGLAQAVGPVAGDDEVAANLSPINLTQAAEELAQLAASIAPAMKAAMGSQPRSIKELLNIEQTPDEENEVAFEQDPARRRESERESEYAL